MNHRQIYYTEFHENITLYLVGDITSQEDRWTNGRKCVVFTYIFFLIFKWGTANSNFAQWTLIRCSNCNVECLLETAESKIRPLVFIRERLLHNAKLLAWSLACFFTLKIVFIREYV